MSHESESLETRLARCERTLFGEDDSSKGLSARMHMTETTTAKIDANINKLVWLVITAVLVGLLNLILPRSNGTPSAPHQSTSVITGDATDLEQLASHRTYLTTADVAAKEKVSVRKVIDMIANGEIIPKPEKSGREYNIDPKYQVAANDGIQPQPAADCGNKQ